MPLDDTYIHFQYTRQMAEGHPYQYNSGDDPTSGATSFLYSPLLAAGYFIGFKDLLLAYWAVGIGAVCLLLSAWLIYQLLPAGTWAAYLMPILFLLMGAMSWAAFSGMETLLFVLAVLFALYAYQKQEKIVLAGALVALVRPEGALITLTLIGASLWENRKSKRNSYLVAVLAIFVQPMVNWLVTGSPAATGNQAKSHLYNTTQPFSSRLMEMLETWLKIWRDLLTGYSPVDGWYVVPVLPLLALVMVGVGAWKSWHTRRIHPALLAGVWMVLLSGAVATLDTANWHFKRYQMPIFALMIPLAGWALESIPSPPVPLSQNGRGGGQEDEYRGEDDSGPFSGRHRSLRSLVPASTVRPSSQNGRGGAKALSSRMRKGLGWGLTAIALLFALWTTLTFVGYYAANSRVVKMQQLAMAQWVDANLPQDARVAVHDVGVMRYVGKRHTIDVVGLTTEGYAAAWRQGPGTLYEQLTYEKPDYFAIYPDVLGLPFLVEAGVYGEELARFEMKLPPHTAASATGVQVVTRADWSGLEAANEPHQIEIKNGRLLAVLNVADLNSEADFRYQWHNDPSVDGFITMVRRLPYAFCTADPCAIIDGGRVIRGEEKFDLPPLDSGESYLIVGRADAASSAALTIGCGAEKDTAVVPALPGQWIEIPILSDESKFCLRTSDHYYSYRYWIYAIPTPEYVPENDVLVEVSDPFRPESKFQILDLDFQQTDSALTLKIHWQTDGKMKHDGKFFVHVYADPSQPPVAQMDTYLNDQPPANWLPGQHTASLTLNALPVGEYRLAVGFYDPVSNRRYSIGQDDRFFLGTIRVD